MSVLNLTINEPVEDFDLIIKGIATEINTILANALIAEGIFLGKDMVLSASFESEDGAENVTSEPVSIAQPTKYRNKYFDRFENTEDDKMPGVPKWMPRDKDTK